MDIALAKRLRTLDFNALSEYAQTEMESVKKLLLQDQPETDTAKLRGQARTLKELIKLEATVEAALKDS